MLKLLFIIIFTFFCLSAFAQEEPTPPKEDFLDLGAGWAYAKNRDHGTSPMLYTGSGISGRVGYIRQRKVKNQITVQFYTGNIKRAGYPQRTLSNQEIIRMDINYMHLRPLELNDDRYRIFIGGAFTTTAHVRNHYLYGNNSYNYDVMSSLGIAGELTTDFSLFQKRFTIDGQLVFPVMSLVVRPYFASSRPPGFITGYDKQAKRFLQSAEPASFGSYTRLNTNLALTYNANNGNGLRLGYNWDIYSIYKYDINRVTAAQHLLSLSLLYNLGKWQSL